MTLSSAKNLIGDQAVFPQPSAGKQAGGQGGARHLESGDHEMDFLVPGMHCAGCIRKLEQGLSKLEGVEAARANLTTRRVRLRYRPGLQTADLLRQSIETLGFDAAPFDARLAGEEDEARARGLLRAMAVSGFAAANVMLLSVSVWAGLVSDMDHETRALFHWLSALIALPAVAYAGMPFYRSAAAALRHGRMNMDVPISLGVILASAASLAQTLRGAEHVYFDASISLVFFLLIGRTLDHSMRHRAGEAARNLLAIRAIAATKIAPDGQRYSVPVESLVPGDRVFVAAGMRVPGDGKIIEGRSDIDLSLLTGESLPLPAQVGMDVFAGTLNQTGPLIIEIMAAGEDTVLADMARLMDCAEQGRAGFVRLADRIARFYAPLVHLLAAGSFIGWMLAGADWYQSLMISVAVLIITCPCALGLAVPVVQVVASGMLLRLGVLVKSPDGLERLAGIDLVVFDKTGTLSHGHAALIGSLSPKGDDRFAAALARQSQHPLSKALFAAWGAQHPDVLLPRPDDVHEEPGCGLSARFGDDLWRLGSRDWVQGISRQPDDRPADVAIEAAPEGPVLWCARAGGVARSFAFQDRLRPDAATVVAGLKAASIKVHLLSGDQPAAVAAMAARLGIDHYKAGAKPADKIAILADLAAAGHKVLMVGDGLNDAPALRAAHVSMSPASAADITQTAADFIFQSDSLLPLLHALHIARRARAHVIENFAMALGYNLLAVPLAVAGYVTPLIAALAMSSSSLIVTLNALRLRLSKTSPGREQR
ncbi:MULTISPECIES: heavy metal translocating P-type ATPase [unclassified Iodidimonas]|jgi:Cu2+-exporting ATPase|uniref:heavy metal translocating P-type ATPase n=1 Tax=unclassified Iodidimonas TaxID=2626145 RepID=UPI002482D47A|nr:MULTISPECIES: heavy metal translocating P-type ATPase [unclassified Iodidimonas]